MVSAEPRMVAGRYRLDERIGSGGMGVVWRAHDELLHRTVAVKQLVLGPGLSREAADEGRARAMREGRIAARLQHPHAINVFDVALGPDLEGGQDAQPWLVMEYLPSRSLADVLAEGPLPAREVARIGRQVADALAAAHREGIVHRDVKPGNVLIGANGTVKITDFGIARATWDETVTRTGVLTGTPAYFAPEVARGEAPDPASDVFSLGSTLYAAVEGVPPFGHDENTLALLRSIADGDVRPPLHPGPLSKLLMQMLRYDPEQRPVMAVTRDLLGRLAAKESLTPTTSALPAATDTSPDRAAPTAVPPPAVRADPAGGVGKGGGSGPPPITPPADVIGPPDHAAPVAAPIPAAVVAPAPAGPEPDAPEDAPAAVAPEDAAAESSNDEGSSALASAQPAVGPAAVGPAAAPMAAEPAAAPMPAARIEEDKPATYEPATFEPAADEPAPAHMPATRVQEDDAAARPRTERPRWWERRRALAGMTVLLLIAIAAAILALNLGRADDPSTTAQTPSSSGAPVTNTTPTPTPDATTATTAPTVTTPAAPAASGPAEFEQAVRDYYSLLPDQLDAAYAYLGPAVQDQANGRDGFENFWSQYSEVEAENVRADGTTVTLTIVYTEQDGTVVREPYILEMGTAEDGRILILTSAYGGPG